MGRPKDKAPVILPFERPKVRVVSEFDFTFGGQTFQGEVELGPASSDEIPIPTGFTVKALIFSRACASALLGVSDQQVSRRRDS